MKVKLLLAALFLSCSAIADTEQEIKDVQLRICEVQEKTARSLMTIRQQGFNISDVLLPGTPDDVKPIIIDAWEKPLFSSAKHKQSAINEFSAKWGLECYKKIL